MDNLPFSPPNILLVDDVSANLVVLTEIMRNEGYIVRPVTNAKQAVNAIEVMPPNLIIMDISMPDIDGLAFCSMLKKNAITREIPVIFISALSTAEDRIRGLRAGAVDYIIKPFTADEVALRINIHLNMYKTKYELETNNKKLYMIINNQIRKLYEEQKNVINVIARLISKNNIVREKHLDFVAKNSRLVAMSLQLSTKYSNVITASFIEAIELASPLHDIGMVLLEMQYKKEYTDCSYNKEEFDKLHTTAGAEFLKEAYSISGHNEFLKRAIEIALYHHEHWDGSGYPEGIGGADIPLCARIVAIVCEFNILINKTGSDDMDSREECLSIIRQGSGSLYDPDIVEVFNKIVNQLKY